MDYEEMRAWMEQMRKANSLLLISHVSPDGDTIGSVLGLRLALLQMGKKVQIVCDGTIPDSMDYLSGHDAYLTPDQVELDYDTAVAVDVSSPEMMGESLPLFERAEHRAVVDHHATNPAYGEVNWIRRGESACCQLIYDGIRALDIELTKEMATCILTGLSTDTGHFQYAATNYHNMESAADLVRHGADISYISRRMYRSQPMRRVEMTKIVYRKMHFECDGQIGAVELEKKNFDETGCSFGETDGLVNLALEIEGVRFAYLLSERENGIKVSLRAVEPDTVNDVALQFGGGGHAQAAGCTLHTTLEEASTLIFNALKAKLG